MRADLAGLSEETLADLTNKGTVRRAVKELAETTHTFTLREDGCVLVEASDGITCELLADRAFADWTCSCLAGHACRHIVRAVLAYQQTARQSPEAPSAVFDPATIDDTSLAAALSPQAMRASARLLAGGALGLVGLTNNLTVVRIHYPTPVTVRFLAGTDLRYVRCTCRDVDPCVHVPVAVAIAKGRPFGETGLRACDGDDWAPDRALLTDIRAQLDQLAQVGIEASQNMRGPWLRLRARCDDADLPHLADLISELDAETTSYAERSAAFDPSRFIALSGELLARSLSLSAEHPDRIPDRLVAGTRAQPTEVTSGKLIGLGTEVSEAGDRVRLTAYLVDARSGSPLRVRKDFDDPELTPVARLGKRLLGGVGFDQWGGGQVVAPAGKRFVGGDFTPGRGRVVTMPKADLAALSPPFLVDSIAELAAHQTRLPPVLDDRSAGTDLAACRFASVEWVGFDSSAQELVAELRDSSGAPARLALPRTSRVELGETAELLTQWVEQPPAQFIVSGRWRWSGDGVALKPLLLVGDDVALQPAFGRSSTYEVGSSQGTDALTSPAALLRHLDALLGEVLIAGLERLASDPRRWVDLAAKAKGAGSNLIASLAKDLADNLSPTDLWRLALISVLGHPMA